MSVVLRAPGGFGPDVEGEIVLSRDTFSIRYDMDRETGMIARSSSFRASRVASLPAGRSSPSSGGAWRPLECSLAAPTP